MEQIGIFIMPDLLQSWSVNYFQAQTDLGTLEYVATPADNITREDMKTTEVKNVRKKES